MATPTERAAEENFRQAVALHQSGHLAQARSLYEAILQAQPKHLNATFNLGLSYAQQNNLVLAAEFFGKAAQINPGFADAHFNCGLALRSLGNLQEALQHYDRAIRLKPDHAIALYNRGAVLYALKRHDEALQSFGKALTVKSDYAQAYYSRGIVLHELARYSDALRNFDSAIAIAPNNVEALFSRAAALNKLKRYAEALETCNRALQIRPDRAEVYSNRGIALVGLRRFEEALQSYDRALQLVPAHAEFHYNRGIALAKLKRFDEAVQSNDRAIQLEPDHAAAYAHRGIALYDLKRFEEAVQSYDRAIQIKPDYAEAYSNRGNALDQLSRFAEGMENRDRALRLTPDYADAYHNKSLSCLLLGKFDVGWKLYEWRKRTDSQTGARTYPQPEWLGEEDIAGKTLFVHWEQGLGDTIQFSRYARLAEARQARVIFSMQDALMRLLKDLSPSIEIIGAESVPAHFDYHVALLSMPLAFRTDATNFPADIPYLRAEPDRREKWKLRLGEHGYKIGIAWQASKLGTELGRSFPVTCLHAISKLPAVRLISLQKYEGSDNQGSQQVTALPEGMKVESLGDDFDSGPDAFLDTAAVIENLDLVISADTSIAHVAGALGRPAWIALKRVPDWRWQLDRSDSPWYPTLRLFRQQTRDDWSSVFSAMEQELARLVEAER